MVENPVLKNIKLDNIMVGILGLKTLWKYNEMMKMKMLKKVNFQVCCIPFSVNTRMKLMLFLFRIAVNIKKSSKSCSNSSRRAYQVEIGNNDSNWTIVNLLWLLNCDIKYNDLIENNELNSESER